jgi:hypothetical protein
MERREALKYTALYLGVGLSASSVAAILNGCQVDTSMDWEPSFFTKAEIDFLSEVAETMLPRTSTPGANDALVHRWLDTVRPLRYTEEDNRAFRTNLKSFMKDARSSLGVDIVHASSEAKLDWLKEVDRQAYEVLKSYPEMEGRERPFYLTLKEQILAGYFNAEIVAKEFFAFDPIPGGYEGCIPYADIGRAWA